ncbi:DoxX family protein [Streptomyces sp. NPDC059262]|uniref:DoxX family protein n=1 Tax=Streptomyces sp. NPDC059262 TaxID=3346797 RepID=UPI003699CA39
MNVHGASGSGRDTASLALRATLGPMLMAHGWNKLRGAGGIAGTTKWFDSLGLRPAGLHARVAAGTELAAGAGLLAGLANPLPAAAAVGLMTVAARTDHRGKGFFVFKGGWEYTAVVGGAAVALAALGHGRWSLDGVLPVRTRNGTRGAVIAAGLGTVAAGAMLRVSYRPAVEEPDPGEV